jgi:hypothetical protein
MSQKIRNLALAGLVLALAAGTTAIAAWAARQDQSTPPEVEQVRKPMRDAQVRSCAPSKKKNPLAVRVSTTGHKKTSKKKESREAGCTSGACCVPCCPPLPADTACKEKAECCVPASTVPSPSALPAWVGPCPYPLPGMMPSPISYPTPNVWPQPSMPMVYSCPVPEAAIAPPPPPACTAEDPFNGKEYSVEMKMVECRKGEKDKVTALPRLIVLAGQSAQLSSGKSYTLLWEKGVPANDMGHEGIQIGLMVAPEQNGRVCLSCSLWRSAMDEGAEMFSEGRCQTTQMVKLGEIVKVPLAADCSMEFLVKECKNEPLSVSIPAPMSSAVAPSACVQVGDICVPFQGCRMIEPQTITRVAHISPVCPAGMNCCMTIKTVGVEAACEETGKQADVCQASRNEKKQLEICCCGTTMTCEQTVLKMRGCPTLKVVCAGDRLSVIGETIEALADSITTDQRGTLILEGHVCVVSGSEEEINVEARKVRINLKRPEEIPQTGLISSPALVK